MRGDQYAQWRLTQAHEWSKKGKLIRSGSHPCEGHRFFKDFHEWIDPRDERWVGRLILSSRQMQAASRRA